MVYLILGLVIFLGIHCLPMVPARHGAIKARLGDGPYRGLYSVVAAAGLVLIVYGFGAARAAGPVQLYEPPFWLRHLTMLLMLPVFVFLVAAYFPGRIKAALKHPMLAAVKIWALGHLLANGELNSVLLFGSFLAYGVIDRIAVKKRGDIGPGPDAPVSAMGDVAALVIGTAAYAAILLWLHPILFGVAALPA